ncbi:MAG: DUF4864 domain-containing protein [Chthoniobacterales bacterium]|nr:DUF4864 domain-containing protein [Chthoniobacterales bacterium]
MSRLAKASLLFFFLSLCAVALFVAHHFEKHAPPPAPRELFAAVNDQLAAFRAADFPSAYRCAAAGVQHQLTLAQFESMVRRNYGAITRANRVEFGSVKADGSSAVVQVFFFGPDGGVRCFLYSLTAEGGGWKIEGVEEIRAYESAVPLVGSHA